MKHARAVTLIAAGLPLAGCQTRSISHSAYREAGSTLCFAPRSDGSDPAFQY
jgi:hypothetical protein